MRRRWRRRGGMRMISRTSWWCRKACKSNSPWSQLPILHLLLLTPKAPDHLPLPEQCNHFSKKFSRKSGLSKHMLVVHKASRPLKILQDRYLAKLMARRRISFVICYIALKFRNSFNEHMKRGSHLLAPGHEYVPPAISSSGVFPFSCSHIIPFSLSLVEEGGKMLLNRN